jgi:ribonuclease P protein component
MGNAVQRNRAKRRLRAACDVVPLQSDTAYVLIASRDIVEAPFDQVVGWLQAAVQTTERGTE